MKYTDLQLASGVARCRTMRELLIFLGLAPRGGNYESVRRRIRELGLNGPHLQTLQHGKSVRSCTDSELIEAVRSSKSFSQVLTKLGIRPGGNQSRIKNRIERLALDTSHFSGQAWRKGSTAPVIPRRPLGEVLVAGRFVQTSNLKRRLIEEGLKERMCEICRREEWNEEPIPLELDHLNGRRDDNRLDNLRIVCPNCHAQTSTYRGRNIGAANGYSETDSRPGGGIGNTRRA
jgi:hypothetical protein